MPFTGTSKPPLKSDTRASFFLTRSKPLENARESWLWPSRSRASPCPSSCRGAPPWPHSFGSTVVGSSTPHQSVSRQNTPFFAFFAIGRPHCPCESATACCTSPCTSSLCSANELLVRFTQTFFRASRRRRAQRLRAESTIHPWPRPRPGLRDHRASTCLRSTAPSGPGANTRASASCTHAPTTPRASGCRPRGSRTRATAQACRGDRWTP